MSMAVITGIGTVKNLDKNIQDEVKKLSLGSPHLKLSNDIEKISVLAASRALKDASLSFPVGNESMSIYAGIDEGIDSIKFKYYENVLREGPLGASPALFPFTSPNAVAAQMAIAFDIRGECITLPGGVLSSSRAVCYASECIQMGIVDMALAGGAVVINNEFKEMLADSGCRDIEKLSDGAAFLVLESDKHAGNRGAKVYGEITYTLDVFKAGNDIKKSVDEIILQCSEGAEIDSINVLIEDDVLFDNSKIKADKPYALSASTVLAISDYSRNSGVKGNTLFISIDRNHDLSALFVKRV